MKRETDFSESQVSELLEINYLKKKYKDKFVSFIFNKNGLT